MAFTRIQKNLIAGSLLGDGNLQTDTGRTWRYRALQKAEHKEYLFHKYEIMAGYCGSPPVFSEVFDERTQKTYKRWSFHTLQLPQLKFYGDLFYTFDPIQNKYVKKVPVNIATFLTPQALAYFYMDDGAIKRLNHSNAMRICTESFSVEEVTRIQKAMETNFQIKITTTNKALQNGRMGKRIAINEAESSSFRHVIQPFLVDPMKYKVSDGNKGHL
jgi:hypothetical protein